MTDLPQLRVAARRALSEWGLQGAPLRTVQHFHNTTFRVGAGHALRMSRPGYQSDGALRSEVLFLEHLHRSGLPTLTPVRPPDGEPFAVVDEHRCLLFEWIPGRRVRGSFSARHARAFGELAGRFHSLSAAFQPPAGFARQTLDADSLSGKATGFPRELIRSRLDAASLAVIDR